MPTATTSLASTKSFYGWKILFFTTLAQFLSVGCTVYLVGLYIEPLSVAFSATPGQLGWTPSILMLVMVCMGPLLGMLVDQGRVRLVMTLGAVLLASGMMLLSLAASLLQAALVCVFLIAPGAAMLGFLCAGSLLSQWFDRRRGMVMGVAAAGISAGGFAMPPIAAWLFAAYGWRQTSLLIGLFIAITLIPMAWKMIVSKPADLGLYPDGADEPPPSAVDNTEDAATGVRQFLVRSDFWFIVANISCLNFTSVMMITYLAPAAQNAGLEAASSAWLISTFAGAAFIGKFVAGWLADQFKPAQILAGITILATLGLLPIIFFDGLLFFIISAAIVGLAIGGVVPAWATAIAELFGPQNYGRVKGLMSLFLTAAVVIPGPLGGYLFDRYGSYTVAYELLIGVLLAGFIATLFISGRKAVEP